jgi:hypothetical protein
MFWKIFLFWYQILIIVGPSCIFVVHPFDHALSESLRCSIELPILSPFSPIKSYLKRCLVAPLQCFPMMFNDHQLQRLSLKLSFSFSRSRINCSQEPISDHNRTRLPLKSQHEVISSFLFSLTCGTRRSAQSRSPMGHLDSRMSPSPMRRRLLVL